MNLTIRKIDDTYAEEVQWILRGAFLPLLNKYHDEEDSPANKTLSRIVSDLRSENSDAYLLELDNKKIGYVKINQRGSGEYGISDLGILPEYQGKGYGQFFLKALEKSYASAKSWSLTTILEEERDCSFYEKLGYVQQGIIAEINEGMHLVLYTKAVE